MPCCGINIILTDQGLEFTQNIFRFYIFYQMEDVELACWPELARFDWLVGSDLIEKREDLLELGVGRLRSENDGFNRAVVYANDAFLIFQKQFVKVLSQRRGKDRFDR